MKIVVLDACSANPGDLSWDWIAKYGTFEVYEYTTRDKIKERCVGADAIIINKTKIDEEMLAQLESVKYIGLLSTGTNAVDISAAGKLGITVTNVPAYSTMSVAQHIFALILAHTNGVAEHNAAVKRGKWQNCEQFCFYETPLIELNGKTAGIIGMGSIGTAVARIAEAFGMKVVYTGRADKKNGYAYMTRDGLAAVSDYIILCCPLNAETANLVDDDFVSKCKAGSVIVNTSRGGTVDENALAAGLKSGRISFALLDVLREEPPIGGSPLLDCDNCMITPHIAWGTFEARARLMLRVEENLRCYISGKPMNTV